MTSESAIPTHTHEWLQQENARLWQELQSVRAQQARGAVPKANPRTDSMRRSASWPVTISGRAEEAGSDRVNGGSGQRWKRVTAGHPRGAYGEIHDAFISNLSHELRTPMHALLGALYLLVDTTITAEQFRYLELITSSSTMLQSLIVDLLDFSAVHTGRLHLSVAPVTILRLVEAVVPMCYHSVVHKGVEMCYWVDPPCMLWKYNIDAARVEQIMLHLLSNAIKFTPRGGTVKLTAVAGTKEEIGTERQEGENHPHTGDAQGFTVIVSDSGVGMSEQEVVDLHRPFGQARQRSHMAGLGVGLSVVWRIVEAMNGSITCDSVVGQGTTFRVSLPCPTAGLTMATMDNPYSLTEEERRVLAKANILIVSRDRGCSQVWTQLLHLYHANVHSVETLEEAHAFTGKQRELLNPNSPASSHHSGATAHHPPNLPIDVLLLDGYEQMTTSCPASSPHPERGGLLGGDQDVSDATIKHLDVIVRQQVSKLCRLLVVFVPDRFRIPEPGSSEQPLSLLSLVARLKGERISCSMRPIEGEQLMPIFEGGIKPEPDSSSSVHVQEWEGRILLTAELMKPFNHRPFLCKVASQLQRLPLSLLPYSASRVSTSNRCAHLQPAEAEYPLATASLPVDTDVSTSSPSTVRPMLTRDEPESSVTPPAMLIQRQSSSQLTPHAAHVTLASTSFHGSPMQVRVGDLRILLVEDNAVNRKLMKMFLQKLGCTNVRVACDSVECLDILRSEGEEPEGSHTQCILMDISMEPMDGRECTRYIRSEIQYQHGSPPVYIVAQTANCTAADRASYIQCGMNDFLPKPISIQSLTSTLLRAHQYLYVE